MNQNTITYSTTHQPDRAKVALVVGAGGVKCAAALGTFSVLEQADIPIDLLIGCSAGSIYTALLGIGHSAHESEEMARSLWTREVTQVKNNSAYLMAMMPRNQNFMRDFALRDDRMILERLRQAFQFKQFEDNNIPLLINATDFRTGESVVFDRGDIVDAIRASIAVPSLFRPWEINGRLYTDGMMSNPLPIDLAAKAGADIIIAVGFKLPLPRQVTNTKRYNLHLNTMLTNSLIDTKINLCKTAFDADVIVIEPEFGGNVHQFDTDKIHHIVAAGRIATRDVLPQINSLIVQKQVDLAKTYINGYKI